MTALSIKLTNTRKVFSVSGSEGRNLVFGVPVSSPVGGKVAVDNLCLTISQGERLGIVGPNGAGKSTLLHMIAGLSSPSSGQIEVNGKITSILTLGVGLREDLSGRDNIYIDGEIQGRSRNEVDHVLKEIIDFADLGEFIDYPVRTYSTGMKARLAFSMISHIEPEILIIDEALSVGDATFSTKATNRIKEICARGKIVIVVSHSMQAVKDICNRCLWMQHGRIVMDGTPAAVTTAYFDSVRVADEAVLVEKFRKLTGARSLVDGWCVQDVKLFGGQENEPRNLLESGQPTRIAITAVTPPGNSCANVRLTITRLDGLLMFEEFFSCAEFRSGAHTVGLEVEMVPLLFGASVYRLEVLLERAGLRCAESACIFEVYTHQPPSGGKPMLLLPVNVHVTTL